MTYLPALVSGIAKDLAVAGLGVYREDGVYAANERGIVVHAFPETPDEVLAVSTYLPTFRRLSPTATSQLAAISVQVKYRLAGHPLQGLEIFDTLLARYDRRRRTLGDVSAAGHFVSFTPLGADANRRSVFAANFRFDGLAPVV